MIRKLLLAGTAALTLTACSTNPATTLATETQAATLATNLVDLGVNNSNLSHAQLVQLQTLNNSVHAAMESLEADNAAGKPLVTTQFDAALAALNAYAATLGVKQ